MHRWARVGSESRHKIIMSPDGLCCNLGWALHSSLFVLVNKAQRGRQHMCSGGMSRVVGDHLNAPEEPIVRVF